MEPALLYKEISKNSENRHLMRHLQA